MHNGGYAGVPLGLSPSHKVMVLGAPLLADKHGRCPARCLAWRAWSRAARQNVLVASAGRDSWFRSPVWDGQIEAAFEQRLQRARPGNRAQYIRIQATYLLSSPDPGVREAGRGLLQRVITEFPGDYEAKAAMEQLGGSLAYEGRLGEAEHALRETLRMCAQSPIGRSGTSGITELYLAEVLLAGGDAGRAAEVAGLLEAVRPHVQAQGFMRDAVFRYLLASARIARLRHDPAARQLARQALAVAAETTPALPRHPDVGRPRRSAAEIAELEQLIAPA